VGPEPLVVDVTEVTSWRERAERAEQRAERAEARVEELVEQVAVLSRMLFGRSSEKASPGPGDPGGPGEPGGQAGEGGDRTGGDDGADDDGERPKRGQRQGRPGHGRRDYSHLDSREEIHDVPPDQRVCPDCGRAFDALGSEGSEQIDWNVTLTRSCTGGCGTGGRALVRGPAR
jgi:transposase